MNKPKFDKLLPLLESGKEFSLTENQYLLQTGADIPKDSYYLKNKSAFSKIAKKYGYHISIKERTICLKKTVS